MSTGSSSKRCRTPSSPPEISRASTSALLVPEGSCRLGSALVLEPHTAEHTRHLHRRIAPLTISHQGQLPALTISFNLVEGSPSATWSRRCRRFRCRRTSRRRGKRPGLPGFDQGPRRAAAGGDRGDLSGAGNPLRELHPPASSFSACCQPALALLIAGRDRLCGAQRLRSLGVIMLIGIVKKNAIMMVDFAAAESAVVGMKLLRRPSSRCLCASYRS